MPPTHKQQTGQYTPVTSGTLFCFKLQFTQILAGTRSFAGHFPPEPVGFCENTNSVLRRSRKGPQVPLNPRQLLIRYLVNRSKQTQLAPCTVQSRSPFAHNSISHSTPSEPVSTLRCHSHKQHLSQELVSQGRKPQIPVRTIQHVTQSTCSEPGQNRVSVTGQYSVSTNQYPQGPFPSAPASFRRCCPLKAPSHGDDPSSIYHVPHG